MCTIDIFRHLQVLQYAIRKLNVCIRDNGYKAIAGEICPALLPWGLQSGSSYQCKRGANRDCHTKAKTHVVLLRSRGFKEAQHGRCKLKSRITAAKRAKNGSDFLLRTSRELM